jgi:hypothetical protein
MTKLPILGREELSAALLQIALVSVSVLQYS